jgi:hypothetical protein
MPKEPIKIVSSFMGIAESPKIKYKVNGKMTVR